MDEQGGGWCPDWLKPDWKVIEGAPRAFYGSLMVISVLIVIGVYSVFKINLELKTDRIAELTAANTALRDENERLKNEPKASASPQETQDKQALRDKWKTYKYIEVWDKIFRDETVPVDGFHFRRCKFFNVTFTYNGNGPAKFSESYQEGVRHLDTTEPVVQSTMRLMLALDDQGRKMAPNMTTAGRPLKPWEE